MAWGEMQAGEASPLADYCVAQRNKSEEGREENYRWELGVIDVSL
jgi:hypothetical protein